MGVYISRVQINNFRNFHELDVQLGGKAVIVKMNQREGEILLANLKARMEA